MNERMSTGIVTEGALGGWAIEQSLLTDGP